MCPNQYARTVRIRNLHDRQKIQYISYTQSKAPAPLCDFLHIAKSERKQKTSRKPTMLTALEQASAWKMKKNDRLGEFARRMSWLLAWLCLRKGLVCLEERAESSCGRGTSLFIRFALQRPGINFSPRYQLGRRVNIKVSTGDQFRAY